VVTGKGGVLFWELTAGDLLAWRRIRCPWLLIGWARARAAINQVAERADVHALTF
jgi:hypothetical protein